MLKETAGQVLLWSQSLFLASNEVCQTCLNSVDKLCSKCTQSQCFIMLFVVHPSGVSRATSSCSPRPSARSLSSQTSTLSQLTLMSCMKTPKISLMDRCVHRAVFWFGFYFFTALSHLFHPFRFLPVRTGFTSYDLPVKKKTVDMEKPHYHFLLPALMHLEGLIVSSTSIYNVLFVETRDPALFRNDQSSIEEQSTPEVLWRFPTHFGSLQQRV